MAGELTFHVADFEGPLDLILTLISKHKLNIYDIEISVLVDQYLAAIQEMQETADLTSEFLEMAAHLVLIKSKELLPKHDEADAMKDELTGQLLEYQIYKSMAAMLAEKNVMHLQFIRSPQEIEADMTYRRRHETEELLAAYFSVVGKSARRMPPPKEAFAQIVQHRVVSVRSRIVLLLDRLYRKDSEALTDLYATAEDRSELVATFLAVLELIKDSRIQVDGRQRVSLADPSVDKTDLLAVYEAAEGPDGGEEPDTRQKQEER